MPQCRRLEKKLALCLLCALSQGGKTNEQMQGFYWWKHASMCQEYISNSSKLAKIRPENCPAAPLFIWSFLTYAAEKSASWQQWQKA